MGCKMARKKSKDKETVPGQRQKTPVTGKTSSSKFSIVAIGASAGGLEDFEKFFRHVPARSGMAFILIPHLEAGHESLLPEIIQRSTSMPVAQAKDRVRVAPDNVYIIPPNKNMEIFGGVLRLFEMKKNVFKSPISHFFSSLARDQKETAIAVVLSGMGSDGTLGAESIKNEGGLVIAEDPEMARYDAMPVSVIKTGVVDHVIPVEKMPEVIRHYAQEILSQRQKEQVGQGSALQKVFFILRSVTGHDFSSYKHSTIMRRLERRMAVLKVRSIDEYVRCMEKNRGEVMILFKEMLIGVTSFFRDPEAFNVLRSKVLPMLFEKKPQGHNFRIWVPACSTGEEAYSIAILIKDYLRQRSMDHSVQIFATDLDEESIDYSRQGIYSEDIVKDVPKELLRRYFMKKGNFYQVDKSVREMIIFAVQNLIKDPPFTRLDLVSCRNFLIYLDAELQDKLMPLFHYVLKPDGMIILGPSESIGGYMDLFSPVDKKWKIYRKKGSMFIPQPPLNFPFTKTFRHAEGEVQIKRGKQPVFEEMIDRFLLDKYSPKAVVINEEGEIFYIHGRTGKYLEPAPGNAKMNVFEMAREGLRLCLETLVHKASQTKKEVLQKDVSVKANGGGPVLINVIVRPFSEPDMQGLFLVLFEEPLFHKEPLAGKKLDESFFTGTKREQELAHELQNAKVRLQSTLEEMETSNEELKSANEEYQSTNEELKSANEELETSREEMQSLNEELTTVNSELQGKVDELSQSHKAMKSFLDNLEIPIVVLNNECEIVRFTADAKKIVNLIDSDIGRPLSHISSKLKFPNLIEQAREVIRTLRYKETEVQTLDGRWYLMRILPFKSGKNFVEGVVMIFVDITEIKSLSFQLGEFHKSRQQGKGK